MVTAEETVVSNPPTTNEQNNSGHSSDSDTDKIEMLKAEQREVLEPANGSNGNHADEPEKNGVVVEVIDDDMEEAPKLEAEVSNGEMAGVITASPSEEAPEVAPEAPANGGVAEEKMEVEENGNEAPKNGTNGEEEKNGKGVKRVAVECIQLDDDDDDIQEITTPAPKKAKVEETPAASASATTSVAATPAPAAAEPKKEIKPEEDNNELAQIRLLDKLQEYVAEQKDVPGSKQRKVLDTLLGAINAQVQKEPLCVRKLILDKVLVLPNTISFPPSQVCDLLIEHDPEVPLTKAINRMFGEERPKLSDSEKRERAQLKAHNPVPNMTKLLVDIGQDLVQESTYCDIVHAKNLPEVPKNLETYKQVAAQLKPVWETLKRKNEPYKLKMMRCNVCGFQTESNLVMTSHKATLHQNGNKYQCTFCKETDTNEQRMKDHYFEAHLVIATVEEKESKYPCSICEEDFNFKGVREQHYKQCKKDYIRIRNIMMPKQDDQLHLNRWLWEKPPIDPSILQQQQQAAMQQAQQKRQQQILQQQQATAALRAKQLAQQQQQAQQAQANRIREQNAQQLQLRQMAQLAQQLSQQQAATARGNINLNNPLLTAMQAHIRRSAGASGANQSANNLAMTQMMQKQIAAALKSQTNGSLQAALVAASMKQQQKTPMSAKMAKVMGTSATSSPSSSSAALGTAISCEICDQNVYEKEKYLHHLQSLHKQMVGKTVQDMAQGAPLACSRCRDRFWTYEGLERHLVMSHGLVTADLLLKAQKKEDGGRCKTCGKQYAFNMLQHLVADHQVKLCSAEIMYSCDVCSFKCSSYQTLETHLTDTHPKGSEKKTPAPAAAPAPATAGSKKEECITLDD